LKSQTAPSRRTAAWASVLSLTRFSCRCELSNSRRRAILAQDIVVGNSRGKPLLDGRALRPLRRLGAKLLISHAATLSDRPLVKRIDLLWGGLKRFEIALVV
jgi:hypothetical protein